MMEYYSAIKTNKHWNSLVFWWLELGAFIAMHLDSIPGQGTKIPTSCVV